MFLFCFARPGQMRDTGKIARAADRLHDHARYREPLGPFASPTFFSRQSHTPV